MIAPAIPAEDDSTRIALVAAISGLFVAGGLLLSALRSDDETTPPPTTATTTAATPAAPPPAATPSQPDIVVRTGGETRLHAPSDVVDELGRIDSQDAYDRRMAEIWQEAQTGGRP